VIADSGSCPGLRVSIRGDGTDGRPFAQVLFSNGGMGAPRARRRVVCHRLSHQRRRRLDGGAGKHRAAVVLEGASCCPTVAAPAAIAAAWASALEFESVSEKPLAILTQFDRITHPAGGVFGGLAGGHSKLTMNADVTVPSKGRVLMHKAIVSPSNMPAVAATGRRRNAAGKKSPTICDTAWYLRARHKTPTDLQGVTSSATRFRWHRHRRNLHRFRAGG